uniref:Venom S1 protease 4 n=2 Tax=Panheteroptera TaxID=33351 RepID=A0A2K8JVZ7_9HEMI|nr:venom S1 protease 4 [Lethocerus distinctifemur]
MRFSSGLLCAVAVLAMSAGPSSGGRSPFFSRESWIQDSGEDGGPPGAKATTCQCGWANKNPQRIVGGQVTKVNEYPFMVALLTGQYMQFCGGSLITMSHVLTAAHCTNPVIQNRGTILALAGDHDLRTTADTPFAQLKRVARIVQHEGFDPTSLRNDVSVLVLESPFVANRFVGPVCVSPVVGNYEKTYVKIIGWGNTHHNSTTSPVLKSLNIRVVPHPMCRARHPLLSPLRSQICTHSYQQGACMGDSGGPVVRLDQETNRYTQVGLVSFGRICASLDPTVHTDVSYYMPWITAAVRSTSYNQGYLCSKIG